ncbi:MAG: WXG100 family type VII secretion target [Ruminococcus sp.]|nr:WXG100 family type VII secretion target [Ruminococcus sp.]MCD7773686.1 WXG100 family type VII secretion target [Ruminococcus sp.]
MSSIKTMQANFLTGSDDPGSFQNTSIENSIMNNLTGTVRVSADELLEASGNVITRAARIEESLLALISCAESTNDIWQGTSADEFRARCSAYRTPVSELAEHLREGMNRLEKITGLYNQAESRISAKSNDLPSDAIT